MEALVPGPFAWGVYMGWALVWLCAFPIEMYYDHIRNIRRLSRLPSINTRERIKFLLWGTYLLIYLRRGHFRYQQPT